MFDTQKYELSSTKSKFPKSYYLLEQIWHYRKKSQKFFYKPLDMEVSLRRTYSEYDMKYWQVNLCNKLSGNERANNVHA